MFLQLQKFKVTGKAYEDSVMYNKVHFINGFVVVATPKGLFIARAATHLNFEQELINMLSGFSYPLAAWELLKKSESVNLNQASHIEITASVMYDGYETEISFYRTDPSVFDVLNAQLLTYTVNDLDFSIRSFSMNTDEVGKFFSIAPSSVFLKGIVRDSNVMLFGDASGDILFLHMDDYEEPLFLTSQFREACNEITSYRQVALSNTF
jgi:hypothetical protein